MIFNIGSIDVYYDSWMEGGGTWFGQEYPTIIRSRYPERQFAKCYEWCSGPGFIGFSILAHGICQRLCLSDCYPAAINDAVKNTVQQNSLHTVSAYHTATLKNLPDHELFDLVVANPPHFLECPGDDNTQRIKVDSRWQAHRDFFQNIGNHLLPNAVILLQENQAGSLEREKEFEKDIIDNGLMITDVFDSPDFYQPGGHTQIYYIEIKKRQ